MDPTAPTTDALAWPVVAATMKRAASNLELIVRRLHELGYRWASQARGNEARPGHGDEDGPGTNHFDEYRYDWQPPAAEVLDVIERIDRAVPGGLPLALRGLFRFVGGVDLAGSLPNWRPSAFLFEGPEPWPEFGLYSGALMLFEPEVTLGYIAPDTDCVHPRYLCADGSYCLYLGLDTTAVAGFSGSCHLVRLPSPSLDPLITDIENHDPMSLVDYLRWVFDWGGFPGLERSDYVPDEIEYLRSGLAPL